MISHNVIWVWAVKEKSQIALLNLVDVICTSSLLLRVTILQFYTTFMLSQEFIKKLQD